jgi:hypothetical protein
MSDVGNSRRRRRTQQEEDFDQVDLILSATENAFATQAGLSIEAAMARIGALVDEMFLVQGMTEDQVIQSLATMIENDASVFGETISSLDANYNKYGSQLQVRRELYEAGINEGLTYQDIVDKDDYGTWICAGFNVCPDCIVRHGMTATIREFEAIGMPGTGWSFCGDFCQCVVKPTFQMRKEGLTVEQIRRPVLMLTKELKDGKTATGLKIKPIEGIIANRGADKIQAALDRSGRIGLEQRRFIRALGKFAQ